MRSSAETGQSRARAAKRCGPPRRVPAAGLAAVAAVLHVSVLAGRLGARSWPARPVAWCWPDPAAGAWDEPDEQRDAPSHPTTTFAAGQLELARGMAVLTLAVWLHIMHLSGVLGR